MICQITNKSSLKQMEDLFAVAAVTKTAADLNRQPMGFILKR